MTHGPAQYKVTPNLIIVKSSTHQKEEIIIEIRLSYGQSYWKSLSLSYENDSCAHRGDTPSDISRI